MNLGSIKPFVPPILWSATRAAFRPGRGESPGAVRSNALALATEQSYQVDFLSVEIDRSRYFVPAYAQHRPAAQCVLHGELYEPDTHKLVASLMRIRPGAMIHAGTFFGDMLPSFAGACPDILYAFEPVLENFVLARLCVEANRLENVFLINAGLGHSIAPAKIDTGNAGGIHRGGTSEISETGQACSLMTVDSLGLAELSVLHLDVENHEFEVLQGARATIARCHPVILIEDYESRCPALLAEMDYVPCGELSELSVWASPDWAPRVAAEVGTL